MRSDQPSLRGDRDAPLCRAKTRIGLALFAFYALCYGLFIAGHVVFPHWSDVHWCGIAAGVIASVALMVLSVLVALLYHLLCSRAERMSSVERH